jgi:hypothetical protein
MEKMKKVILITLGMFAINYLNAQTETNIQSNKNNIQPFVEFSPFLAGFQLLSVSAGVEYSKYQIGLSFSKGTHNFTHGLSKTTFSNFGTLHFLHNQSEEIFVKRYFLETRKGLYIGLLFNLTHWEAQNDAQKIYVNTVGKYLTTYTGYRWFPLKKYNMFYVEPNLGVSFRLNGKQQTTVGNQSFSYLQPPIELTPNVLMGARFNLAKKK